MGATKLLRWVSVALFTFFLADCSAGDNNHEDANHIASQEACLSHLSTGRGVGRIL